MRRLRCSATAERELGRYDLRRKLAHGDLGQFMFARSIGPQRPMPVAEGILLCDASAAGG